MHAGAVRAVGATVLVGAVVATRVLARRTDGFNGFTGTIYPWWCWALVAAAAAGGLALLLAPRSSWTAPAAAAALVAGGQLLGTGIVAVRHWRSAMGMGVPGGTYEQLPTLVPLAGLLAVAGAVVAATSALVLARTGTGVRPPHRVRVLLVAMAAATALVVPVLAVRLDPDVMSWGAAGLISVGPWAAALALAAASPVRAARALAAAVAGSAAVVTVGPHMAGLSIDGRAAWGTALLLAAIAVAATVRTSTAPEPA